MFVVKIVGAHVAKLSVGARSHRTISLVFDGQLTKGPRGAEGGGDPLPGQVPNSATGRS